MYEPVMKLFQTQMEMQMEGEIMKAVQEVGVVVDKDELIKALNYDRQQYQKGYEDGKRESEWIPCSERLPDNEQEVEITYVKKHWQTGEPLYFTCRAFYTDGTVTTEESGYAWNETDNWEYDEKLDAYIIPEGWWECVSFAEEFGVVDEPVIAWMPLPEPYKESEE